jgi:hypothetical protein
MIMGGAFAQRNVSLPLMLRLPDREALQGTLVEVTVYAPDDGARRVIVHVDVDLETFQRIEDEELVGFVSGSTAPQATDYRLLSTAPVTLQLLPDPAALGDLPGAPLEELIDGLVAALGATDGGPLQEAATYRWHSIMQEQTLRPGITVKRGFGSVYTAGRPH